MTSSFDDAPNLLVVDEAFGPVSDLYVDVLGVQPNASSGQIQNAYFDRRDELFGLLNDIDADKEQDSVTASHRLHAERKLDGVVVAVRILGDAEMRLQYDDLRHERLEGAAPVMPALSYEPSSRKFKPANQNHHHNNSSNNSNSSHQKQHLPPGNRGKSRRSQESRAEEDKNRSSPNSRRSKDHREAAAEEALKLNRSLDSTPSDEGGFRRANKKIKARVVSPEQEQLRKSRPPQQQKEQVRFDPPPKVQTVQEDALNTSFETATTALTFDEDRTIMTFASQGTLVTHATEKRVMTNIHREIAGTLEDTQTAFSQIFSVFTLRDEDISAVTGKIDKAKRQIERNLTSYD